LHRRVADGVAPDGKPRLESELHQVADAGPFQTSPRLLLPADLEACAVRKAEPLREMIEHQGAAERSGEGGHEEAMVAAGRVAGKGASAEPRRPAAPVPRTAHSGPARPGRSIPA